MKIAILGSGNVGGTLGWRWTAAGHEVTFGARDPDSRKTREAADRAGAAVASIPAAVRRAEVVVLAVPWSAALATLSSAGELRGKVVLDCTNPLRSDLSGLDVPAAGSAGQQVADWAPGARVVKIFNTTGAANMAHPVFGSRAAVMPYAGDDPEAKAVAAELAADVGFEALDAGPLSASPLLENLALLWITLAYRQALGTDFAFALLRREP